VSVDLDLLKRADAILGAKPGSNGAKHDNSANTFTSRTELSGGEDSIHLSDLGNARRLVRDHGDDLRYCKVFGKWFVWHDGRWRDDGTDEVVRRTKKTVGAIYAEAANAPEDERKALAKHALKSEAEARIHAMIGLAESEPTIPILPNQLDQNPWIITVKNGTIDLKTGTISSHRRDDLVTKMAPVTYVPDASCPLWLDFLDRAMGGNEHLVQFLQRAIGYSLTGTTVERIILILFGGGKNGKSTLLEVMRAILGDYAMRTPTEMLLAKRGDAGIPNDVARLKGARFVSASEAEEGQRLAEAKIKDLTGGDTISARFMRGEFFDFQPAFKLWLSTNHKPVIKGTDEAIWDRIRLVPFLVRIPPEEQDKHLRDKLIAEAPGILAWAVEGCLDWQRDGLGEPEEVKQATGAYRAEMDVLGGFITDCCVVREDASGTAKELYATYTRWCEDSGEKPISQIAMGKRLAERGFDSTRIGKKQTRTWLGIGIRSEDDPEDGQGRRIYQEQTHSDASSDITELVFSREDLSGKMRLNVSASENASAAGDDIWTR